LVAARTQGSLVLWSDEPAALVVGLFLAGVVLCYADWVTLLILALSFDEAVVASIARVVTHLLKRPTLAEPCLAIIDGLKLDREGEARYFVAAVLVAIAFLLLAHVIAVRVLAALVGTAVALRLASRTTVVLDVVVEHAAPQFSLD